MQIHYITKKINKNARTKHKQINGNFLQIIRTWHGIASVKLLSDQYSDYSTAIYEVGRSVHRSLFDGSRCGQ